MNKETFSKIVNKYLNGTASKKEAELYESVFDSLQKTKESWNRLKLTDKEKLKNDLYKNIMSHISGSEKPFVNRFHILKIAASILILVSLGFVGYLTLKGGHIKEESQLFTEMAQYGDNKTIILEDSSKVILNAGSKVSFYKPFSKNNREITLSGEAFFDVSEDKNRPFIVRTGNIATSVLGTSFNIHAYIDEDINVTVSAGKVKVTYTPPDGSIPKTAILLPGEQAVFSVKKGELSKYKVDINQFIDWRNNVLRFQEDYFSDVIKKLERNYDVDIHCEATDLLKKTITSVYENAELTEILDDLSFILGFEYSCQSNKILITD